MTTTHPGEFARHQQASRAAINHQDRALAPAALNGRRRAMREKANADLAAQIPAVPTISRPSRDEILDALRPSTADEVQVAVHQRERIQADLDRGRRPEQILASADLRTVVSLLDWLPTMPGVKDSTHHDDIVAEIQALAFDRLGEIGHGPAAERIQAEQEIALPAAWARVMAEAVAGQVTTGAWTDLYRVDPEGYREAQAAEIPGLAEETRRFDIMASREVEADQFAVRRPGVG